MADISHDAPRPLSPHLSIYRFHFSMALSILHRAAGVALTAGLIGVVVWLWAAAYDDELFSGIRGFMLSTVGMGLIGIGIFVYYFKMFTGLRHLWWDTGRGFALTSIDTSGKLAITLTLVCSIITWAYLYQQFCQE